MLRGLWGTCAGGLMDSLSETAGNNRPIQGLSDELLAMALKGQAEKRKRHLSTDAKHDLQKTRFSKKMITM